MTQTVLKLEIDEENKTRRVSHPDIIRDKIRVLGSHWNRNTIKSAEVRWNAEIGKWECELTRNLGYFDSASEAGDYLTHHLNGVENWFLDNLENGDDALKVMGVRAKERLIE